MSTISIATAAEVFDLLKDDLAAIEAEFARQADSPVAVVTDIANYLISGGGKRIRPMLLLLSAKALDCHDAARIRLGAVVEMLHTATLVHDDIIDEASTRRGPPVLQRFLGQLQVRPRRRLALHAGLPDGARRTQLPYARPAHLAHPADGRR